MLIMNKNLDEKEFYRKRIMEMVGKIENPAILKFILLVIKSYLNSRD